MESVLSITNLGCGNSVGPCCDDVSVQRSSDAVALVWNLQPIRPVDVAFLREVHASTLASEPAMAGWGLVQKADFLRVQFDAQDRFYRTQFPDADFLLIQSGMKPVGRIYLDCNADEILIIDVALLPSSRRMGLGRSVFTALLGLASETGKTVRGQVEWSNPAIHFFESMGFQIKGYTGTHYQISWSQFGLSGYKGGRKLTET